MRLLRSIFALLLALSATASAIAQTTAPVAVEIPNLAYFGTSALGFYVHAQGTNSPGDGGDGYFYRNGLTCTVDGTNIIKDKSGNCFYRLQKTSAAISPLTFGAKCDGVTDDAVALQATENAAGVLHVGIVYPSINTIGTSRICKTLTTLIPTAGVDHFCQMGMNAGDGGSFVSNGQCGVTYNGTTGNAIWELNNANGVSGIQSPTWHDMYMTSSKGCIKLNDPAGGFTDTGASQNYMLYPRADRVVCAANTVGFYCAKCFYASISDGQWNGQVGIRLEGSDINVVKHNQMPQFTDLNIDIIARGTFSNDNVIKDNFLECSSHVGTAIACIQTSGRYTVIENNSIECSAGSGSNMIGAIRVLSPALQVVIQNNTIACALGDVQHGLSVETDPMFLAFTNNTVGGPSFPTANFNGDFSVALFPSSVQAQLVHYGNTSEAGFPFTTYVNYPEADSLAPNVLFTVAPGANTYNVNIGGSAYAPSVRVQAGAYVIPAAGGGGNVLLFNAVPDSYKGTLNVCVEAASATAGQQMVLGTQDGGAPVSSTTFTLTANRAWYCKNGVVYATGATFSVLNSDVGHNGSVKLYRGTISQ